MSDKYVRVSGEFKHSTPDAVLMIFDDEEVWIPRRHLSWASDKAVEKFSRGDQVDIEMREWLAQQEGLG